MICRNHQHRQGSVRLLADPAELCRDGLWTRRILGAPARYVDQVRSAHPMLTPDIETRRAGSVQRASVYPIESLSLASGYLASALALGGLRVRLVLVGAALDHLGANDPDIAADRRLKPPGNIRIACKETLRVLPALPDPLTVIGEPRA